MKKSSQFPTWSRRGEQEYNVPIAHLPIQISSFLHFFISHGKVYKVLVRCLLKKIMAGLFCVIFLSHCTQKNTNDLGLGYYGPKTLYESPFTTRKLLVGDLTHEISESEIQNISVSDLEAPNTLVAVIDNQCSDSVCGTDKVSRAKLSCYLAKGPERNPVLQTQAYTFKLNSGMDLESLEKQIEKDSCVVGVSEDRKYRASFSPNDPLYSQQAPYLNTIKWSSGMDRTQNTGGVATPGSQIPLKTVKVAIIDSGVGVHPDLDGVVIERLDARSLQSKALTTDCPTAFTLENPLNTHATFVAGIVGGKVGNSLGVTGISGNVEIISIAIGNCKGEMSTAEVANALGVAFSKGAEVINLSLGGASEPDPVFENTLTQLLNKKAVVTVAAGNEFKKLEVGSGLTKSYPASYASKYPGVISVAWGKQDGTLQTGDRLRWGSNYGKDVIKILAPGDAIVSTMSPSGAPGYQPLGSGYGKGSGSSFSNPIITGAAAFLIGFLKQNGLDYDERMIEDIILKTAQSKTDLQEFVQGGRLLDFDKLVATLLQLSIVGVELPLTASAKTMRYNTQEKASEISVNISWDIPFPHYGARLGVFDLSEGCNFSEPCRIQDFEIGATKGTKTIRMTRNETLPMVSSLSDPTFSLNLVAAVYYRVPKPGAPGKFKNGYGIDAKTSINLRDFDNSNFNSPLIGEVIEMRTDQDRLFINGWVCLQDSNKAIRVELLDPQGNSIPSNTAYHWPQFAPIGRGCSNFTLDDGFTSCGRGNGEKGVFPKVLGQILQKNLNFYPAGLESTPLLMVDDPPDRRRPGCHTMTANHGFEFIVPFDTISQRNLFGKKLKVRATHPVRSQVLFVPDQFGQVELSVPKIAPQNAGSTTPSRTLTSNVQLNRNADEIQFRGSVCSKSPSPITLEVSYSAWGLNCRLKNAQGFPLGILGSSHDPATRFCTIVNGNWPYVYDPNLGADRNKAIYIYPDNNTTFEEQRAVFRLFDLDKAYKSDPVYLKLWNDILSTFPGPRFPNALVQSQGWDFWGGKEARRYREDVGNRGLIDIEGGKRIVDIVAKHKIYSDFGAQTKAVLKTHGLNRAGSGLRNVGLWSRDSDSWELDSSRQELWDWYDVGEFYTPGIVAYNFDETTETGRYLKQELLISKVMRQTKKYETPLPSGYQFLGETQLIRFNKGATCFEFPISYNLSNLQEFTSDVRGQFAKLIVEGEVPPEFIWNVTVEEAMRSLPVEIRFFQDGVLIEHLLSDFGSNTYRNIFFTNHE